MQGPGLKISEEVGEYASSASARDKSVGSDLSSLTLLHGPIQ